MSNRCSVVTICNYETYQDVDDDASPSAVPLVSRTCPAGVPHVSTTEEGKERKEVKKKKDGFTPPTVDEVKAYCKQRKNNIDPQQFVDHYVQRDWKPKGYTQRMKDWRAAVRTWEKFAKQRADSNSDGFEYADLNPR